MKTLLLLFIPFACFGQVWFKDVQPRDSNVKKVGEWAHMNNEKPNCVIQSGSFPRTQDAYLKYTATMFQLEIFSEYAEHHNYYIIDIDGVIDTVNVKKINVLNIKTFQRKWNLQKSRTVKIYGNKYVINYLRVFVDSDPLHRPIYEDSIACRTDTIFIDKPVYIHDTVYQEKIVFDTIWIPQDTLFLQPNIFILADTLKYELK